VLLLDVVVFFGIIVLTPNGQFLGCDATAFSEKHIQSSQAENGLSWLAVMSNESRIQKSVVKIVVFCDFVLEVVPSLSPHPILHCF